MIWYEKLLYSLSQTFTCVPNPLNCHALVSKPSELYAIDCIYDMCCEKLNNYSKPDTIWIAVTFSYVINIKLQN